MKNCMKKFIALLLGVVFMASMAWSQNNVTITGSTKDMLVIETTDGARVAFHLSGQPVMTMGDDEVTVKADGRTLTYPLSEVSRVRFDNSTTLAQLQTELDVEFTLTGTELTVSGAAEGLTVNVYKTNGALAATARTDGSGCCTIDLSALPAGVYVVTAGKISYKIAI